MLYHEKRKNVLFLMVEGDGRNVVERLKRSKTGKNYSMYTGAPVPTFKLIFFSKVVDEIYDKFAASKVNLRRKYAGLVLFAANSNHF